MSNDIKYTATLKITQTGEEGPVGVSLSFDPMEENTEIMAFILGSELARHYLEITGYIDDEGNLIDEEGMDEDSHIVAGPETLQ